MRNMISTLSYSSPHLPPLPHSLSSRLPDNLKALFRPVAMGAPDNELIAEVSLVTEGFTQAKVSSLYFMHLFSVSCS